MKNQKTRRTKSSAVKTAKKTTRVTVDFPVAQHRKLKAIAALQGVSLQEYIRHKVIEDSDSENCSNAEVSLIVKDIIKDHSDVLERLSKK